jgi:hypothetical protein
MSDKDLVDLLDEIYHTYGPIGSPRDETKPIPPVTCIAVERTPVEVFAALTSDQVDHWDFEDRHLMHKVAKAIVKARSDPNPS